MDTTSLYSEESLAGGRLDDSNAAVLAKIAVERDTICSFSSVRGVVSLLSDEKMIERQDDGM